MYEKLQENCKKRAWSNTQIGRRARGSVPEVDDTIFGLIARAMMYVVCACRFVFRSSSLDIIGGDASLTTRDDISNRTSYINVSLSR